MQATATSAAVNFAPGDSQANPDFLAAIIQASETYSIVASQDIVDVRGLKLWAKGLPVSAALQQRLLERKLLNPIEACLMAEDGVTHFSLMEHLKEFLASDRSMAYALRPYAQLLEKQLKQIPLHSVAQLLLTTAMATRPGALDHAVQAMALAGGMAQAQSLPVDVRLAMVGGLLHDIGEAYIQPQYLDGDEPLDLLGHQHMMAHPRIAQLLLEATTDYPTTLCRAVGEHHERANGSGYPARLHGEDISPLGMLLAAVETTMGVSQSPTAPLFRASFALRVVPGEFPSRYSSVVFNMARDAREKIPTNIRVPADALQHINATLEKARLTTQALQSPTGSKERAGIVLLADDRLARLRTAWNALGVWGLAPEQLTPQDHFEMDLAWAELRLRLFELQRECMLLAESLSEAEKTELTPIWADLKVQHA
ncbi:HD domain-containing protein [Rhodoferax sp. AJA081-3]|uniref:HD-GYP domain-containing protein n=1 Tax=Rhodoferax sp. AJA081-3 TaxID=2752316 RepID=UPI001AE08E20|nr:HD domain-containing phosphohydrolase [Rhodoferax sp. AJA081-3]QTN28226.1 HD domain-containing protein [Rhodoferax sp. AJA081-3]